MRKMYIIHAPGGQGYYLVQNTEDSLSTHVWHHGNYGLQRARQFNSKVQALVVIRSGFRDAAGHPARIVEVETRTAYCATTQVGRATYWLCPGRSPHVRLLRWRSGSTAPYDARRFSAQHLAQEAARGVRIPEGAGRIMIVRTSETILVD